LATFLSVFVLFLRRVQPRKNFRGTELIANSCQVYGI